MTLRGANYTRDQNQNFKKKSENFDKLSIMHERDIFLRLFSRTIIVISRTEAVDQILKQCHDSMIIDRF